MYLQLRTLSQKLTTRPSYRSVGRWKPRILKYEDDVKEARKQGWKRFYDMIRLGKYRIWLLFAVLTICGTASFVSCSSYKDNATEQSNITTIADKVWAFSQDHPDGFTIDIRTMTEPTEGIAVSYAATQNSHSRNQRRWLESFQQNMPSHRGASSS